MCDLDMQVSFCLVVKLYPSNLPWIISEIHLLRIICVKAGDILVTLNLIFYFLDGQNNVHLELLYYPNDGICIQNYQSFV